MKNLKNLIMGFASLFVLIAFTGCEEDEIRPTVDLSGANFVSAEFTNPATASPVELTFENAASTFEGFAWTSSEFGVKVPVQYTLQVSGTSDFSTKMDLGTTSFLNQNASVAQINTAAITFGLEPFVAADLYFRVVTEVQGADVDNLISQTISRTVTPYITDFPSIYMIGDALKGWDTGLAVEVYGTGPNEYSAIAEFSNDSFRFFEQADWDATSFNYTYFESGTVDSNLESANDGDTNLKFIGAPGFYRITVNLNAKTIEMAEVDQPMLFMVGAGVPSAGWNWDSPIEMTWVQDGIFEATTQFANDAFRFFTVNGDWGSGRNYPYYEGEEFEIDPNLVNAADGDSNFKFSGEPGEYKITVNEIEKTITLTAAGTAGSPLFLVGDGTQAGWDWASPVEAAQLKPGVFRGTVQFNAAGAFRFFTENSNWDSGKNYPYYVGEGYIIDSRLVNANDGDSNFKFTGTDGTYTLTVDDNLKMITIVQGEIVGDSGFLVGDGTQAGWGWDAPVEALQVGTAGVYRASVVLNTSGAFRFFTENNNWDSGRNYPYYQGEGYTIDASLVNAADGDSNFKFTGTPGLHILTIDENNKTITVQ